MVASSTDEEFPCSLIIYVPFPSHRLASAAVQALSVDQELSSLVKRAFSLVYSLPKSEAVQHSDTRQSPLIADAGDALLEKVANNDEFDKGVLNDIQNGTILKIEYKATTNRMLRVSVNSFFDSLGTVIEVMSELDMDVLHEKGVQDLEGAQGIEHGLTGSTVASV